MDLSVDRGQAAGSASSAEFAERRDSEDGYVSIASGASPSPSKCVTAALKALRQPKAHSNGFRAPRQETGLVNGDIFDGIDGIHRGACCRKSAAGSWRRFECAGAGTGCARGGGTAVAGSAIASGLPAV